MVTPWEKPRPEEEVQLQEPDKNLEAIKAETERVVAQTALEEAKGIRDKPEVLASKEAKLAAKELELTSRGALLEAAEVAQKEKALEFTKVEGNLRAWINRVQTAEAESKEKIAGEMEKHRLSLGTLSSYLETLAIVIFHLPVTTKYEGYYKSVSPEKRNLLIERLEPVMKAAGISIALNDEGEYIPIMDRRKEVG